MPRLSFLALLLLGLSSCDLIRPLLGPTAAQADRYQLRARYEHGACYGRCEVFALNVYGNGLLVFEGERFTEKPGTWEKSVDRRIVTALLDTMAAADFATYPAVFRADVPDASPITVIYYDEAGRGYETNFKDNAPPELLAIGRRLHALAHRPDYLQVSEDIRPSAGNRPATAEREREELIVHLTEGTDAYQWVVRYAKQNVAVVERISPNGNYWVISTDPNLMPAEDMLEFIRQDTAVISAQRNRRVGPR